MLRKLEGLMLALVGVINLLPVIGVFSASQMAQTYDVLISGNDMALLLRHRALMFGIIGGVVIFSLFKPFYRPAAMTMAGISMLGFMGLVLLLPEINSSLMKIFVVDAVGVLCLLVAIILHRVNKHEH